MSIIKQDDGSGHCITLLDTDGYRTCTFGDPDGTTERIRKIQTFKCRPDDVFVCAPAKSGTHWTWEIISMLYQGSAETITKSKMVGMIEAVPWDNLECQPSPRVLNTHVHYHMMPKEAIEMRCKIVYVVRNPKDVAVSLYNHVTRIDMYEYDGKWEHFLPLFLEGKTENNSWFEYVLKLEEFMATNPNLSILLLYYENLKKNNLQEIYKIGNFLGIENKDSLYEAISLKCQFHNMAKDKQPFIAPENVVLGKEFTFYRKGVIGDWKNWFTVAQSKRFDKIYAENMKTSKLTFQFS